MRARVYFPVLRNGVKTETFSPQNDCTTELNVNFLLTATVHTESEVHDTIEKASVGMHSGWDKLTGLQILFVYFLTLPSLLYPSILFNCF